MSTPDYFCHCIFEERALMEQAGSGAIAASPKMTPFDRAPEQNMLPHATILVKPVRPPAPVPHGPL